jgi:hypothetical protein
MYSINVGGDLDGWRTSIMNYLSNPSAKFDRSIWQLANNYIPVSDDLYGLSVECLSLRCLNS